MALGTDLHAQFGNLSDERWRELLMASIGNGTVEGAQFPGFPEDGVQVLFTSMKREETLEEALTFFRIAKAACARYGRPLGPTTRLLDFGVGWGRICRTFMKDVAAKNIFGVDVNEDILATCQRLVPYGSFSQCANGHPLAFEDQSFDLVVAFSVFSHLSEANHWHWLKEIHRVLRPGGISVFTTLAPSFLGLCASAAENPSASDWHRGLAQHVTAAYPDWRQTFARFDPAAYFYLPSGGGLKNLEPENYGWAMVQRGYAERSWRSLFEVCEYLDDAARLKQACFVLRRRG